MENLDSFFQRVSECTATGSQDAAKRAAAQMALDLVEPGMTLGLGTGSTVEFFLQGLAERISQGLDVRGIPTSSTTERRAQELGIPLLGLPDYPQVNSQLCVDGADRVDLAGCLIKGGGGALLREKLVATHSEQVCILVDPSKLRDVFDSSFAIPVECVPFGIQGTMAQLKGLSCEVSLRESAGELLLTDNGNLICDCRFASLPKASQMETRMACVPGVVEVGIFTDLLDHLVVGFADGTALKWTGTA